MSNNLRLKIGLILVVLSMCGGLGVYPMVAAQIGATGPRWLTSRKLKLGLDLQGGVHLILAVQLPAGADPVEREETMTHTLETIERRVNDLGVAEPVIAVQGANRDQILVQLPGVTNVERAKAIIQSTGVLEITLVEDGPAASREALLINGQVPSGMRIVTDQMDTPADASRTGAFYLVRKDAPVAGRDLRTARPALDEDNRPAVHFTLNAEGGRKFGELTGGNIGRAVAVILDGRVQSVARIEARITTDGRILGNFSQEDVQNLSVILRSGSLSVPLTYLAEQTIGPSLGADAIRSGVIASAVGLLLIVAFMLSYYRWSGLNAVVALVFNLVIVLGLMAYLGAVMTLPGIAGFVLTMGIGVDSNVLIFERIKEELDAGKGIRASIDAGFDRVFRTLLDTHVAALVAAALLFQFGTGPIRGFALTLSIGLVSNLFTSTFVSRTLFDAIVKWRRPTTLSI